MATGNRLLIVILSLVILAGAAMSFALVWTGKPESGAFLGLATTALGVLCPSPLRGAQYRGGPAEPEKGIAAPGDVPPEGPSGS